jgi:dTDP-4-amino-4,6-dideoxygalactose transaminase
LIPFNVPYVPEISKQYVLEALESGHQQGDGPFTARASKMISDLVGGGYVLLTPSCTHALEMASMLANLGPGDEVILPSYTFTSAATAITKFGATPVFVDIEMDSKGIDVNQVRDAITSKTRAISWVNYAGVAPDIEGLQSLAKEFGILLIEDNAHGLGGTYKGKPLGSFGDFATHSFHATKNIQCGEGGALVINNPDYVERAEIIREKGTDRSKFIRGVVQKYQWVDQGSSYLIADSLAALLLGQLESFHKIQLNRGQICESYSKMLLLEDYQFNSKIASKVAHMFYIQFDTEVVRDKFISSMKDSGVSVASHYEPLHASRFGRNFPNLQKKLCNSENTAKGLVRLPVWMGLQPKEISEIIEKCFKILQQIQNGKN